MCLHKPLPMCTPSVPVGREQGLDAPVTDTARLRSTTQRLYLLTSASSPVQARVLGGLKVGPKRLFLSPGVRRDHTMLLRLTRLTMGAA